jgi:pimeloyl-ACP methyl ester carboxylesterase
VGSKKDFDRLMDFVFVKSPPIPGTLKRYFANNAIHHSPLNKKIGLQIKLYSDFVPLEVALRNSKTRTLVLWGDGDRVLHVSGADVLHSAMPNAQKAVMNNVGHIPMLEKPKDAARIFINFHASARTIEHETSPGTQ